MFCAVCTKPFLYFLRYHPCFFLVTLLRHASSSPVIVSCPISDRCAGSRSAIQRDASLGGSCATRVCLCAVNSSCPLRHSFGGSARTGAAAVFGVNARCVVADIRRYGALRCPGHSPIWRAALSRTFADMARCVVADIRRYGALCCPARCCYSAGHRWAYKCLLTQASFVCYSYIITRGYGIPGFFLCAVLLHKGVFHHVLYRCRSRRYQYCHRYR